MAQKAKSKAGKYNDSVSTSNITDPKTKDRDDNGFPYADREATGILRKKFLEYISEVRATGGGNMTENLREARKEVVEIALGVAKNYQVCDAAAVIMASSQYEMGDYETKGAKLRATNQKVQAQYLSLISGEDDMCELDTKEAENLGVDEIISILTCLTEATCQVNKRNEGKKAFVQGPGYVNEKKGKNEEYLASLKEAITEMIRANSVNHYWNKLAKVEKHGLSTLMRILQKTVCPPFMPKDYRPNDMDDVDYQEECFLRDGREYYDSCSGETRRVMVQAMDQERQSALDQDDDFSTIFDGDLMRGTLFSDEKVDSSKEFEETEKHYEGQMDEFELFIQFSYMIFMKRGEQYFESQRKYFDSDGGLDSNLGMMNAVLGIVETVGEGGVFLMGTWDSNAPEPIKEVRTAYEEIRQGNFSEELPEITIQALTDEDAEKDPLFKETEFVKSMNVDTLGVVETEITSDRFNYIMEALFEEDQTGKKEDIKFEDVCVVIGAEDVDKDKKYFHEEQEQEDPWGRKTDDEEKKEGEKSTAEDEQKGPDEKEHVTVGATETGQCQHMRKDWVESGYFKNEEAEGALVEAFKDEDGKEGFFTKQAFQLFHDVLAFIDEKKEEATKAVIKEYVKIRAPLLEQGTDKEDKAKRIDLLKFLNPDNLTTGSEQKLKTLLNEMTKSKDLHLDHYHQTYLDIVKIIIWDHLIVKDELTEAHYKTIEAELKPIAIVLANLQENDDSLNLSGKRALIRMIFGTFFVRTGASIGLKKNIADLPLEADVEVHFFIEIRNYTTRNTPAIAQMCNLIHGHLHGELVNLRAKLRIQNSGKIDPRLKRKLFSQDNDKARDHSTDKNPANVNSVHAFCQRTGKKVVDYTNTKSNCLFHTIRIVTGGDTTPKKMRENLVKFVQANDNLNEFFLEEGQTSKDPTMITKAKWMKIMVQEDIFGDQIAMNVMLEDFGNEIEVFHTDGYSVIYNEGRGEKSKIDILCQQSFHFLPVTSAIEQQAPNQTIAQSIVEMIRNMQEKGDKSEEKSNEEKSGNEGKGSDNPKDDSERSEAEKKILLQILNLEVDVCQVGYEGRASKLEMRLGNDSYSPVVDGDSVEFVHAIGRKTFKNKLVELVEDMIWNDYGCTFGNGKLAPDYIEVSKVADLKALVSKALEDWNSEESKKARKEVLEAKKPKAQEEKKWKAKDKKEILPGAWSANKKLVFNCDVLLVGQKTYVRILMAIVSAITKFYRRQTLDFTDFNMQTIEWQVKRFGVGMDEVHWDNIGKSLIRNMKKKFNKELYLFPLLPRKQVIVNFCGAANLISTELSYMMNGGEEVPFRRLCQLCVMACKADIPENTVHAIHQYLLNSVNRAKFLSNKTTFVKDLWENVKFRDEDAGLKSDFKKGKPDSTSSD